MSKTDSYEVILDLLRTCGKDIKREDLKDELHVKDDLGLDSFQIMEMIGQMEDRFDVDIPDRRIRSLQTVGQISDFIAEEID